MDVELHPVLSLGFGLVVGEAWHGERPSERLNPTAQLTDPCNSLGVLQQKALKLR